MKVQIQKADELHLDNPLSPEKFGRWVFYNEKPLQWLAALGDRTPWQSAFFAGWESFVRQSQKKSDYLGLQPRRAFVASAPHLKGKPGRLSCKTLEIEEKITSAPAQEIEWIFREPRAP